MRYLRFLTCCTVIVGVCHVEVAHGALGPQRFDTDRPHRAVVLGGSITAHPANFGKFIQYGCTGVELVNYGKARLKSSHLLRRFRQKVLGDEQLMAQLKGRQPWLLYLGGLNGIYLPKRVRRNIAETIELAHKRGFRVMALTLPPWGSLRDRRFRAFEGLFQLRATALVNDFIIAKPSRSWSKSQLADVAINIYDSKLRDRRAPLRGAAQLQDAFATSRYKRRRRSQRRLIQQARRVPRMFMRKRYRGRYHFHPNWRGHRLIAKLICVRAPRQWACDCPKIARAWPKNGRIFP